MTSARADSPTPTHRRLYLQVLVAIVAGALLGHLAPATGAALGVEGGDRVATATLVDGLGGEAGGGLAQAGR